MADIDQIQVSLCNGIEPKVIEAIHVVKALQRIQTGNSKEFIEKIRSSQSNEERTKLKKQLPAIIFQGRFSYRDSKHFEESSQLAIMDSDHVTNPSFYRDYIFKNYNFVLASWISPSGDGVKYLCKIPKINNEKEYKEYYQSLLQLFDDSSTDPSNSDISRICFESWDPNIKIRDWKKTSIYEIAFVSLDAPSVDIDKSTFGDPLSVAAKMIQNAKNGSKHFVLLKAATLLGGYIASDFISEDDSVKILEAEIQKKDIESFEAAQKTIRSGIKYGKQKPLPPPHINKLNNDKQYIFWYENKKGLIQFDSYVLMDYLQSRGIYRYYTTSTDYIFVIIEDNLVEEIDIPSIKKLLVNYVLSFKDYKLDIALQRKIHFLAGQTNLQLLENRDIPIFRGERDAAFIFYLDYIIKVTTEIIMSISYTDFKHLIWKNTIIQRKAPVEQEGTCEFETFINNVFKDQESRQLIQQAIGYLLHNYKDKAFMPAIILNDNNEDENSQGGTGKGIIRQAINKFLITIIEDGKRFDTTRVFTYQNLNFDTQLLVIDDAKKHFNMEALFSFISEGVYIEKKGKQPIKIDFTNMPKILITTNYAVKGAGESHKRRRIDVVLDNHYSSKHTPLQEFGHMLFDDWDEEQWNLFDIFMLRCINTYLVEGLIPLDNDNLQIKQFRLETHPDFEEFAERLEINIEYNKTKLLNDWKLESGTDKFTKRKLTTWFNRYAELKGYELISDRKKDSYEFSKPTVRNLNS